MERAENELLDVPKGENGNELYESEDDVDCV